MYFPKCLGFFFFGRRVGATVSVHFFASSECFGFAYMNFLKTIFLAASLQVMDEVLSNLNKRASCVLSLHISLCLSRGGNISCLQLLVLQVFNELI